ncbi:CPC cysteine peptidase, Clan CA, family C1, Cathepsin B-like [Novymonas esmeraldas]|uniref:CPC cysteine peptidase, Clan CA, family C1, Cathepsin B-like n=1 Tax=Novymonas esmeraldas TaxID=1808958 RepID=A0AAW0EMY2_9TRYP
MTFTAKSAVCLVALLAVLLAATTVSGFYANPAHTPLLQKSFVAEINAKAKGQWTASADNGHLITDRSLDEVRRLMGVRTMSTDALLPRSFTAKELKQDVPEAFDSAENWPSCPTIGEIRDQSSCGSCWAIAAAEAISDRYCTVAGIPDRRISTSNLLSCCFVCGMGCNGGIPTAAWTWWVWVGLTTETCQPYPFAPCGHHTNSDKYPACPSTIYDTPSCNSTCNDSQTELIKYKGDKTYSVSGEEAYKRELMANGPFEVAFDVYADFTAYKSGVYSHVSGERLGGHAVKLVGWGVQDGTPYWKIANSWNTDWGNNGYFYIKRGDDECGIESSGVAGTPSTK